MAITENVPLAPLTTFRIGGPARFFASARTVEDLREFFEYARSRGLPVLILGGGSNLLVGDRGFDGVVIKIDIAGMAREGDALIAGAGESWEALVERAAQEQLWGLENLSGIPGTVGGAVAGSIGAYGAAVAQTLLWAEVFDARTGALRRFSNAECALGYRDSAFKRDEALVVVRAAFGLSREARPNLSYKDLAPLQKGPVTLEQIREAVLAVRRDKFPDTAQEGTAGSYFKNLLVPPQEAQRLRERYPQMPLFAMPEAAGVKVPLAWLFDKVLGLHGAREGGARVFERQPLVIAARFGTSAQHVLKLAQKIKDAAKENLNLEIEEEVKIVG